MSFVMERVNQVERQRRDDFARDRKELARGRNCNGLQNPDFEGKRVRLEKSLVRDQEIRSPLVHNSSVNYFRANQSRGQNLDSPRIANRSPRDMGNGYGAAMYGYEDWTGAVETGDRAGFSTSTGGDGSDDGFSGAEKWSEGNVKTWKS